MKKRDKKQQDKEKLLGSNKQTFVKASKKEEEAKKKGEEQKGKKAAKVETSSVRIAPKAYVLNRNHLTLTTVIWMQRKRNKLSKRKPTLRRDQELPLTPVKRTRLQPRNNRRRTRNKRLWSIKAKLFQAVTHLILKVSRNKRKMSKLMFRKKLPRKQSLLTQKCQLIWK